MTYAYEQLQKKIARLLEQIREEKDKDIREELLAALRNCYKYEDLLIIFGDGNIPNELMTNNLTVRGDLIVSQNNIIGSNNVNSTVGNININSWLNGVSQNINNASSLQNDQKQNPLFVQIPCAK